MSDTDDQGPADGHESLLTLSSLRHVAETIHQPMCVRNTQQRLVLVNAAFVDLAGRTREELIGTTDALGVGECQRHALVALERQVIRERRPLTGHQQFGEEHGEVGDRLVTKLPLTGVDGAVTHVISVVGGAGERAESRQQLVEELERYAHARAHARAVHDQQLREERLMILGQLAAGLAHQIRNPLGAIANAIALARRQLPETVPTGVRDALQIANDEIWEANRIIADLLDYARIRPPQRKTIEVLELVEGALAVERCLDGIDVQLRIPSFKVSVDAEQVKDALRNLFRNAREAMNDVGTLTISVEKSGGTLLLRVQDTGVGVPEENQSLLFEPLVSSKPLGMGLGLATARSLIVNQGGTLEYDGSGTDGACFAVRLPLSPSALEDPNADR